MTDRRNGAPALGAVVFDMDGIIFDTEPLYFASGAELLGRRGKTFTIELAHRMMGVPGKKSIAILREHHELTDTVEALMLESETIFRAKLKTELKTMRGFFELLEWLEARGIPKAVATSTRRETTDIMLAAFDLHKRFEFVLTADDVTHGKPHPEIYQLACSRLSQQAESVVVIEDSFHGTCAAKAAGCRCVAVPHELSRMLDFSIADFIADHLIDPKLLEWMGH